MNTKLANLTSLAFIAALIGYIIYLYPSLPDPLPGAIDLSGIPVESFRVLLLPPITPNVGATCPNNPCATAWVCHERHYARPSKS